MKKEKSLFGIPPVKHLLSPEQKKLVNLIASNFVDNIIKKANEKGRGKGFN